MLKNINHENEGGTIYFNEKPSNMVAPEIYYAIDTDTHDVGYEGVATRRRRGLSLPSPNALWVLTYAFLS